MQEYILKSDVIKISRELQGSNINKFVYSVDSLPTIVHHEYKVGEKCEMSFDGMEWKEGILTGFEIDSHFTSYKHIRPLQSEHPDITQAVDLLRKNGYNVEKNDLKSG